MKKADASLARFAVIIGDDEAAAGELAIKPLRGEGEQRRVAPADAVLIIRETVNGKRERRRGLLFPISRWSNTWHSISKNRNSWTKRKSGGSSTATR
jgi:hypothetical protein